MVETYRPWCPTFQGTEIKGHLPRSSQGSGGTWNLSGSVQHDQAAAVCPELCDMLAGGWQGREGGEVRAVMVPKVPCEWDRSQDFTSEIQRPFVSRTLLWGLVVILN